MVNEGSIDTASWAFVASSAPWFFVLLAGLLLAVGVWRLRTRKARRLARSVAARRALRERGMGPGQLRRERQVAPQAPDTGPQERSTRAGTHSVSVPQPAATPQGPIARSGVDTRAATVVLAPGETELPPLGGAEPSARPAAPDVEATVLTELGAKDVTVVTDAPAEEATVLTEPPSAPQASPEAAATVVTEAPLAPDAPATVVTEAPLAPDAPATAVTEVTLSPTARSIAPQADVQLRTTVVQEVPAPDADADAAADTPAPRAQPANEDDVAALDGGLEKTRAGLWGRLRRLFGAGQKLGAEALTDCEDVLLTSDVGVAMTDHLLEALKAAAAQTTEGLDEAGVRALLRRELLEVLARGTAGRPAVPLTQAPAQGRPKVVLFVGVNGVGKTTTIGKVAHALGRSGSKVMLAAGDTYRAAAAEQLTVWGERTGARVVRGAEGADPASVMFSAVEAAKADGADVVLADTAGRLHTQNDLMDQIKKVGRALAKLRAGAPDETWLVVDATTGQNALHQARAFHQALGLTGLVLTKLDGTAKGGVLFAIVHELQLPVRYVGLGERAESLQPFVAEAFVDALLR